MKRFFIAVAALFCLTTVAHANELIITVDISDQMMLIDTPYETVAMDVSTGAEGSETPTGVYQPYLMKPMHYSSQFNDAPMPYSIFFYKGYAIHGTESINSLGYPDSAGCVRLHPENANWVYRLVREYGKENTIIIIQD